MAHAEISPKARGSKSGTANIVEGSFNSFVSLKDRTSRETNSISEWKGGVNRPLTLVPDALALAKSSMAASNALTAADNNDREKTDENSRGEGNSGADDEQDAGGVEMVEVS